MKTEEHHGCIYCGRLFIRKIGSTRRTCGAEGCRKLLIGRSPSVEPICRRLENGQSPNAPGSAQFAATADGTWLLTIDYGDMKISVDIGETEVGVVLKHGGREDLFDFEYPPNASGSATEGRP